jgi:hypothetical protein
MNVTQKVTPQAPAGEKVIRVAHVVKGVVVEGDDVRHTSRDLGVEFTTPALDLEALAPSRSEPGPLFNVKLSEIIDFLEATGQLMDPDRNVHMQECVELTSATNILPKRVLFNLVREVKGYLTRTNLMRIVEMNFNPALLDGWVPQVDPYGNKSAIRAFPPRLIHVLAGNSPMAAAASMAQGALVKAVNLFKMPSNDPFTPVAILKTMMDVDPNHPVVRSMSAVYWRGGDVNVERTLYRSHYFDKIVAWGGGDAINNVIKYTGPGFQLVSFDPKTSVSMVGREALASDASINEVAERAAADVAIFNQEACSATRFLFMEGDVKDIDRFCAKLAERLAVDRDNASAKTAPLPGELREEVEMMRAMRGAYGVWGSMDGSGLVIRSTDPVDFHPVNKTVNVVVVPALEEATQYANVATQTVSIYPEARKAGLRDALASMGAQRIVNLGSTAKYCSGSPHDAMMPLHRFVHWMVDESI